MESIVTSLHSKPSNHSKKFVFDKGGESSVLAVIRLDANMTSSIDALLESFKQEATADVCSVITKAARRNISRSGTRAPLDSVVRFRRTLPDAASLFLHDALSMFQHRLNLDKIIVKEEVSFSCNGSKDEILRNGDLQFTKAFKHPKNGIYYASLTSAVFSETVNDRIGAV